MEFGNVLDFPGWYWNNIKSVGQRAMLSSAPEKAAKHMTSVGQKLKDSRPAQIIMKLQQDPRGAQYAKVLADALQSGPQQFAIKYYILSNSIPGFQEMVGTDNEGK